MVKILDIPEPPQDRAAFRDLYLVFEYVESDLAKVLSSQQPLLQDQLQYITMQLLAGMRHMHAAHVLHRDLKPQNVLISRYCEVKICDLGLARGIAELGASNALTAVDDDASVSPRVHTSPLQLTRQLTKHVVTRWYRPPELILQKADYTHAIDVWSIGCIFAELLHMHISNGNPGPQDGSFVLFPGKSCFPMSPSGFEEDDEGSQYDQLNVIFNVIGLPTQQEIAKVQDETAKRYLLKLASKGGIPGQDLKTLFPGSSATAIELLQRMISFDVDQRITIEEAMADPFFNEGRARENNLYSPICCDSVVDKALSFDFELLANPSSSDIKTLMYEEVARFNRSEEIGSHVHGTQAENVDISYLDDQNNTLPPTKRFKAAAPHEICEKC